MFRFLHIFLLFLLHLSQNLLLFILTITIPSHSPVISFFFLFSFIQYAVQIPHSQFLSGGILI